MTTKPLDPSFKFCQTPNKGGKRDSTRLIVLHYTASDSLASSVSWLCDPQSKASAHFVVGRDGAVTQLVDVDVVAWHAGRSFWQNKVAVNSFSVGIELVNVGPLVKKPDGSFVSSVGGRVVKAAEVFHGKHQTDARCPYEHWQSYTKPQVDAARDIIEKLKTRYPEIEAVVGHSDVSPTRKLDPGPAIAQYGLLS